MPTYVVESQTEVQFSALSTAATLFMSERKPSCPTILYKAFERLQELKKTKKYRNYIILANRLGFLASSFASEVYLFF